METKPDDNVKKGPLMSVEEAKQIARMLFERYDKDHAQQLTMGEVAPMMIDTYKSMKQSINPSVEDTNLYFQMLDRNKDGRVTLADIEEIAIKYLANSNWVSLTPDESR